MTAMMVMPIAQRAMVIPFKTVTTTTVVGLKTILYWVPR